MELIYLGQSAFMLRNAAHKTLIDPWLNNNPVSPWRVADCGEVDIVVISHGHSDHFGDTLEIMAGSRAKAVCGPEIGWYLYKHGYDRNTRVFPVSMGGTVELDGLRFTMVNAVHSNAIYGEEWVRVKEFLPGGAAGGFVIRGKGFPTIYHAGDTDLFGDMALIRSRFRPQVALLPIGGRYTMDWEGCVEACVLLQPEMVIPMHYNTYPELRVDVSLFVDRMSSACPRTEVLVLNPGDGVVLDDKALRLA